MIRVLLLPAALLASPLATGEDPRPAQGSTQRIAVAGVVLDENGHPVPGARLATQWNFVNGRPIAPRVMVTDALGRFAGKVAAGRRDLALVAYDAQLQRAGLVEVDREDPTSLSVTLRTAVRVHGHVQHAALPVPPIWITSTWSIGKFRVARCASRRARVDVLLPQGACRWVVYDGHLQGVEGALVLGEKSEIDLGEVELPSRSVPGQGRILTE